ncbi:MAG: insulinase family protein [Bacilli bacterium]|nr:insulinase family protein [Bacilli bacterium]
MEHVVKDLGSYKLHLIKTDKFKTIRMKLFFYSPIKKDEITIRNFLIGMLKITNKKYPTKRELALKCQDLYACGLGYDITRFGNFYNYYFAIDSLEDKYTEKGNFEKCVEPLSNVIYNPNVIDNKFDEKYFNIVKHDATLSINSIKENPNVYSRIRLLEEMDKDSPMSYRMVGNIDDLNKVTPENLYEYYLKIMKEDYMDIYVIGNFDFNEMEELVKKYFKQKIYKNNTKSFKLDEYKGRVKQKEVIEENDTNQSNLVIGCRLKKLTEFELKYVINLYSIILGGGANSKLFQNIREKNSLCYYIHSVINKLDNLMLIRAGITNENYEKVVKLVKEELKNMKKGKFTEKDIENAKQLYLSSLDEIEESLDDIIDSYYMMDLLGVDDIETKKKKIITVTKEDIEKVSNKIFVDTIYMLEGVKE